MRITEDELEHLEKLARIALEREERAQVLSDLESILDYFGQLQAVDTEGVEEMLRPVVPERSTRPDEVAPSLPRSTVLELSNASEDGFIRVPRTVDEG